MEESLLPVLVRRSPGLCLRPTLVCIVYINDVTMQISAGSTLSLFADDNIMLYRTIVTVEDYWILQCDVNALSTWINENHLSLQSTKCCSMIISRKRSCAIPPPHYFYRQLSTQ